MLRNSQAEAWNGLDVMGLPTGHSCLLASVSLSVSQCQSKSEPYLQTPVLRRETSLVLSFRQKLESRDICFTPGLIYLFIPLHGSVGEARSACKATLTYSSAGSQPSSFSPSEHFQPFQKQTLTCENW
ncbi:unnamed protein product [Rangifer tarandus platyrhynchus]|uniref:Uncharacterized protein n=2 Tax=Rangifer tarandus platyrhynchus TaxID=3082113 RepID=A0ABN8Z816_RANTA|nr:unnamed protein product [Rangifer tarandus platyrhynchus]